MEGAIFIHKNNAIRDKWTDRQIERSQSVRDWKSKRKKYTRKVTNGHPVVI